MNTHLEILIRLFIHVLAKFKSGRKFTFDEKYQLLGGLYNLGVDFFSKSILNETNQLGSSWMEISTHNNICLSDKPYNEYKEEVHDVLQDAQVCSPVSHVPRRIHSQRKGVVFKTHAKSRYPFKVARRRSQSS